MKTKIQFILIISLIAISFFACNYEQPEIPNVPVDITVNLNDPQYHDLQVTGNSIYITGGVNGIIVYRKSFDEFTAYERTCPHDPACGKLTIGKDGFLAEDTVCCGSQFSLDVDGAVVSGESKFPMRMYSVIFYDNLNSLHISN